MRCRDAKRNDAADRDCEAPRYSGFDTQNLTPALKRSTHRNGACEVDRQLDRRPLSDAQIAGQKNSALADVFGEGRDFGFARFDRNRKM